MSARSQAAMSIEECILTRLHCPMGCGQTIIVYEDNGDVECSDDACPDNQAIQKIFSDDSLKHRVRIDGDHWGAVHPLFERVEARLLDCEVMIAVHDALRSGETEGDYLMWREDGEWKWDRIDDKN